MNSKHWLPAVWAFVVVAVLLVAVIEYLLYQNAPGEAARASMQDDMRFELFKRVLEFGVLAVLGGGAALLYKWAEKGLEDSRERSALRKDYVTRLGTVFRTVKEVRRLLRAEGFDLRSKRAIHELTESDLVIYDTRMSVLNKAQLHLEELKIEARRFPITNDRDELPELLACMEEYLGRLVTEYEEKRRCEPLTLGCLERLADFTGQTVHGKGAITASFNGSFVKPHYEAIDIMSEQDPSLFSHLRNAFSRFGH